MVKIVFASTNAGKIRELQALCNPALFEIISQANFQVPEIPETGTTFVENALIKARHASQFTGLPAIADDSGLEVEALDGQPGIYSARYAGEPSSAEANIKKLLAVLDHEQNRKAQFQCVLAFVESADDPNPLICHGVWPGFILKSPQGSNGFGYDPVFFDPINNCSAAELPLDIKNKISHRGQALRLLFEKLNQKYHLK